ncbi:hypothetical protein KQ304_09240 [Synechococcus sp. CS-1329]|jgi:hypothetical protein|uniref:hypothetical protein n=1 Tax=Synechococcus sp. CS-1329 TaxID=2847975 RepID=UPI00223AB04C|nr:hypothetical protein [Synechococcus sp. CS-1329]MCT0219181.1 hypothetical protein [Synechococcus sp. CS-1329]
MASSLRPCVGSLLLGSASLVLVTISPWSPPLEARTMAPPPKTPVRIYQPDGDTCQADHMLKAYQNQLLQFADQPPQVLQRLRQIQLELGEASLKRCANENRISREEADRIWRELQRQPLPGSQPP